MWTLSSTRVTHPVTSDNAQFCFSRYYMAVTLIRTLARREFCCIDLKINVDG